MNVPYTFKFIADPGHGWLQVDINALRRVGLSLADISKYSYRSGDTLYLEEDCDASKFVRAFRNTFHCSPAIREEYQANTFIRNLPRIG